MRKLPRLVRPLTKPTVVFGNALIYTVVNQMGQECYCYRCVFYRHTLLWMAQEDQCLKKCEG